MEVWVGFDMDECLGEFLSLWPFCETLTNRLFRAQRNEYLSLVAKRLEESDQHWLFRPGIDAVLQLLVDAQAVDKLYGCFILSNNGSQNLVECVRMILNIRAKRLGARGELFRVGWSRNSPCRKGDMKKSLDEIQECLTYERLPGARSLLFFDDMKHVLTSQIPNYIQVSPYIHYTPVSQIYHILTPVFQRLKLSATLLQSISKQGERMEAQDVKKEALEFSSPPLEPWYEAENAIHEFLGFIVRKPNTHRTPRVRKSARRKTAKSHIWKRY